MPISFNRYVNITSALGGANAVPVRSLSGRLFTDNPLLPTYNAASPSLSPSLVEFTSAQAVGAYFGFTSNEYYRAQFYFGWISKNGLSPQKISYWRWTDANTAPLIYGQPSSNATALLASFQAITTGAFVLTMGSFTFTLSGLNFSADMSLAAVAATIQTAIQAESGGGALWTGATVTFNNTTQNFNLVGGSTSANAVISVASPMSGTDITGLLGWVLGAQYPAGPIFSNGYQMETITTTLTNSAAYSNDFGSFLFMPTFDVAQVTEAATWNNGQNVLYMYCVPVTDTADASTYNTALLSLNGTIVTYSPTLSPAQYPEQCPMMILAATNYEGINSVQNYMFQQFPTLTPSVTTDSLANTLDGDNTNYYGQTQESGIPISFYQRGLMSGSSVNTNIPIANIYANEQWLKAAMGAAILNLFIALPKISANTQGRAQILTVLQSIINQAINNGTISVGGLISAQQQTYITSITGDNTAWRQVQTIGYWVNVQIATIPDTIPTQYEAQYTLVYKKDDVINFVTGTQILI